MKLYFSPGACSLSPHIALREAGLDFEAVKVALGTHTLTDGSSFDAVNPKGYVPALILDSGLLLTEGPAIVQYIADQKPESHLAPPNGTIERYQLMSWLNFISSELHKQFSPLFDKSTTPEVRAVSMKTSARWPTAQFGGSSPTRTSTTNSRVSRSASRPTRATSPV